MSDTKKYRIGNTNEEYLLLDNCLGWSPVGYEGWSDLVFENDNFNRRPLPVMFDLADPHGELQESLVLHQVLSKDAFQLEFFGEDRSESWHRFAIVSLEAEPWGLFIIPLH